MQKNKRETVGWPRWGVFLDLEDGLCKIVKPKGCTVDYRLWETDMGTMKGIQVELYLRNCC